MVSETLQVSFCMVSDALQFLYGEWCTSYEYPHLYGEYDTTKYYQHFYGEWGTIY